MATGVAKNNSVIAAVEESTEGTQADPASATDGYIQPLKDGFELTPTRENIERTILTNSVGVVQPRSGTKASNGSLPVEYRASGTEGGDVDYAILLESALGAKRNSSGRVTTKAAGNTAQVLQIEDADIGEFAVGDIVVVLEAGAHFHSPITAVDTTGGAANITLLRTATAPFSASVQIAIFQSYLTANSGHPSFSTHFWYGNEKRLVALGSKINSMSLESFETGQVASLNFGIDALTYADMDDAAAPHTPTYDTGLPPVILNACLFQDGTQLDVNQFGVTLSNTLGFISSTCSSNGRTNSRVTERTLTGSFNPYMDDTSTDQFDKFNLNTSYSIFVSAYTPSTTAGEFELGSVVGLYLPNVVTTEFAQGDLDGILTDEVTYQATRGSAGDEEEIYISFT